MKIRNIDDYIKLVNFYTHILFELHSEPKDEFRIIKDDKKYFEDLKNGLFPIKEQLEKAIKNTKL